MGKGLVGDGSGWEAGESCSGLVRGGTAPETVGTRLLAGDKAWGRAGTVLGWGGGLETFAKQVLN